VDEKGTYFKEFPIARYKCNEKGCPKVEHKTFSLLPYQLIPYCKYAIEFMLKTMNYWKTEKHSINKTLDFVFEKLKTDISSNELYKFAKIIEIAIEKIIACNVKGLIFASIIDKKERIIKFIEYSENYSCYKFEEEIRGPPALNIDFYVNNGGYIKNAQFLFGTPSQFR